MALALLVTAGAAFLLLCLLLCLGMLRWFAAGNVEGALAALDDAELPLLPAGHQPPPGLGPISPSERTLAAETARGLRDLQAYLLDSA
ncbi:MAG: hypothetical protein JWP14_2261 [Frankiales bacterium]|nr:hypothetical protein [Frankiales bacterium]